VIISAVTCKVFGKTTIEIRDISELFTVYGDVFRKTFNLTDNTFNRKYKFKKDRGGFLVVIEDKQNVLGLFTLSFAENNFLELGDLMKLDSAFPRETFAIAMKRACNFVVKQNKQNGIYIYPNPYAINLEKMAGFKENSLYVRSVSLVFFNFIFLLPIQVYEGKIHNYWNFYKRKVIRSNVKLLPTRLTIFNFRIFKKAHNVNARDSNIKIGFLYEFLPSEGFGDTFLVFGDKYFDVSKIGFEFCDNSA
jgi:hypothetical protein